jgi:GWxTD domain-containing protein
MTSWIQSDAAKALAWTLVHSLWEGAAIALALAIVFGIARSSRVRYAAACLAMLGLLTAFTVTLYRLAPREISRPAAARPLPLPVAHLVDDPPVANHRTPWDASELLPWLAPVWLAGVLLFQLRCLVSWTAAGRLRRTGVCGPSPEWTGRLDHLRALLRMTRPVTLLESCFAEVPVVIGHLRPVILMPVGLLAGLPAGQVEAILLHELAHIRRADYLVNLMQTLVEGLLFYHPAMWWISGAIRTERENCCDDLVVLTNGDAHEYATALAALAENRWTMRQAALAATGGNLVKRIRRLLAQPEGPRGSVAPAFSVGILVVTGAVALAAWQTPSPQVPAPLIKTPPLLIAQAQTAPAAAPAESPYDKWLSEEVVYIITNQERAEFKNLQTDAERVRFIDEFWKRRDPTPGTPENEFRDEHYRRIAYANDRFHNPKVPGWKTDRGRIYIEYGPPDEIDSHPSGGTYTRPPEQGGAQTVTYPFEQWRYRFIAGIGNNVILEFVDKEKTGEYRLTMDPAEKEVARQQEQAELTDKFDQITASVPPPSELLETEARVEQVQKQVEAAERQLRELELSVPPPQLNMLEAQAQTEQALREMAKLQEKMGDLAEQMPPAQKDLLESQDRLEQGQLEKLQAALRSLAKLSEKVGQQENSVFLSGSGSQAAVVILADRRILITIPFESPAKQYLVNISAVSSDGKTSWSNTNRKVTSNNGSLTVRTALPAGSYTLTASVKDTATSTEKTYVVNFSVK